MRKILHRSKAKAKPQRRDSASSSTRTILIGERTWTDVESGEYSISDYEVSKKLIRLLRHGSLPRDVSLMTARTSMWEMKQIMTERGNPLFAVMQMTSNQC